MRAQKLDVNFQEKMINFFTTHVTKILEKSDKRIFKGKKKPQVPVICMFDRLIVWTSVDEY